MHIFSGTRTAGKKVIPGVRESVADELLLSIEKLDYVTFRPVYSVELVVFLQGVFFYASETARSKFAESETGRNILAPSVTAGLNESDTREGGKRKHADLRDVSTIDSLLGVLRERLEQGDGVRRQNLLDSSCPDLRGASAHQV